MERTYACVVKRTDVSEAVNQNFLLFLSSQFWKRPLIKVMVWSIYSLYAPHFQENVMLTFQTFSDNMKLHIYRNSQKNVDVFGHLLQ